MTRRRNPLRAGAALLITLAVLVVCVSAAATLAQVTATTRAQHRIEHAHLVADDLGRAAEASLIDWLERTSGSVVLPPESRTPSVLVLHDHLELDGLDGEIAITAWDECGKVPMSLLRRGSPMRAVIPSAILRVVDRVPNEAGAPFGLDLFQGPAPDSGVRVFPRVASERTPAGNAIGSWVSTHPTSRPKINVNTAPITVVVSAMRMAGRGGIELIVAARDNGTRFNVTDLSARDEAPSHAPALVSESSAWSFRIDVRVGALRRSWWAVYVRGRSWECVQRLVISE